MSDDLRLPPFDVSDAAVEQLVAAGGSVRVDLVPGGCSGRAWVFTQDPPEDGDEVFGCPGATLVVSPEALPLLSGSRLDYGARLAPPRYRVLGAAVETCPCRRSLGQPWPGRGQPDCRARQPMPWHASQRRSGDL